MKNKLGFIIERDDYYNDYYVDLIFGKEDWFKEKMISKVFANKRNKVEKYQVRLCTTKQGYEIIKDSLKINEPIRNNKIKQITMSRKFYSDGKEYIAIYWNSVFWPVSNKSIKIIEDTIKEFRSLNIPFQYIVMNEESLEHIEILEFISNDNNVNVFSIERKIKSKILNKNQQLNGGKDKK